MVPSVVNGSHPCVPSSAASHSRSPSSVSCSGLVLVADPASVVRGQLGPGRRPVGPAELRAVHAVVGDEEDRVLHADDLVRVRRPRAVARLVDVDPLRLAVEIGPDEQLGPVRAVIGGEVQMVAGAREIARIRALLPRPERLGLGADEQPVLDEEARRRGVGGELGEDLRPGRRAVGAPQLRPRRVRAGAEDELRAVHGQVGRLRRAAAGLEVDDHARPAGPRAPQLAAVDPVVGHDVRDGPRVAKSRASDLWVSGFSGPRRDAVCAVATGGSAASASGQRGAGDLVRSCRN